MWTVVVRDPQGSEICRLPLNGRLVVGRTHDCQIILPSTAISRQHARIELFKERPVFVDLGSSNGSTLNGQPLTKPTLVDEKSRVEIAGFQIVFERAGASAVPPAPVAVPPAPLPAPAPKAGEDDSELVPMPPAPVPKAEEDDLELVPMGPLAPAAPKPASTAPAGMNFLDLPGVPTPLESAPRPRASTDSAVDLLDQQLAGIRTYRDENAVGEKARLAQLDAEWKQVLVAMQQLKDKVGKHPKVQHFTFSRDEQEVSVKVEDSSKRGYSYYVLSRRHPTGKYDDHGVVWLCELGAEELNYKKPKDAMADLVRRLAPRLA
ncbi:MAG: FHA domain-containing protein [Pseudomonadota bacterium]